MRIPFSVYLMPVFWFALSVVTDYSVGKVVAVFLIIHLLVYPASNGYNCYFDRDESSIGGLKHPPRVTKSLFWLVSLFDGLAILGALFVSIPFAVCIAVYLLVSKAYSYDKIRLKKYPFISTIVVIIFQGAFTFLMVQLGIGVGTAIITSPTNLIFAAVSSLFLCGSYPLTQVYQHTEDAQRGDKTISLLLGIQGTFIFSGLSLFAGTALLLYAFFSTNQQINILIFLLCTAPVVFFFNRWFWRVRQNRAEANFENTMLMNKISSLSISLAFILMIIF
ncbi:UbiA family prenyltransferase [Adhaeribacter aerolatus]|nr:UbiA family prenyltransferase [Adhaeribacter aerolatus]